jgi:hypothetical protein
MRIDGRQRPTPLPVQAIDHATGDLMAASVVRGLVERARPDGAVGGGCPWLAASRSFVSGARGRPRLSRPHSLSLAHGGQPAMREGRSVGQEVASGTLAVSSSLSTNGGSSRASRCAASDRAASEAGLLCDVRLARYDIVARR